MPQSLHRVIAASAIFFILAPIASCGDGPADDDGDGDRTPPPITNVALYPSDVPIVLPGSGGVTDRGAASYAMPIRIPDGPNAWKPSLAIDYAGSARANGRLGVGWGLAGISEITPCHEVYAQQARVDGPSFGRNEAGQNVGTDRKSVV